MSHAPILSRAPKIFYGWYIVGAGFLAQMLNSGFYFQGFSSYFILLQRDFGWTRTAIAGAYSLARVEGGLMGPLEGFLIDRLGPRRIMLSGMFFFGLGMVAFSRIDSIYGYYGAFMLMAVGSSLGGFLMLMSTINNWFRRRRTLAMALAQTGMSVGALIIVPILALAQTEFGWRAAALGSGLSIWAVGLPIALLMRQHPEPYGYSPDNVSPEQATQQEDKVSPTYAVNYTIGEALRTSNFWLMSFGHSLAFLVISAASLHQFPLMEEGVGLSHVAAASIVSIIAAFNFAGQLTGGFLGDRVDKRLVIFLGMAGSSIGIVILALATSYFHAALFGVIHGFCWGVRSPITSSLRGDYFGRKSFATISGTSNLILSLGGIFGPLFAGYMADIQGNYRLAFLILAGLHTFGGCLFLLMKPPRSTAPREAGAQPRAVTS